MTSAATGGGKYNRGEHTIPLNVVSGNATLLFSEANNASHPMGSGPMNASFNLNYGG